MRTADAGRPHYRNCNLCEAICGIEINAGAGGRLEIRGDKEDPFSLGYVWARHVAPAANCSW